MYWQANFIFICICLMLGSVAHAGKKYDKEKNPGNSENQRKKLLLGPKLSADEVQKKYDSIETEASKLYSAIKVLQMNGIKHHENLIDLDIYSVQGKKSFGVIAYFQDAETTFFTPVALVFSTKATKLVRIFPPNSTIQEAHNSVTFYCSPEHLYCFEEDWVVPQKNTDDEAFLKWKYPHSTGVWEVTLYKSTSTTNPTGFYLNAILTPNFPKLAVPFVYKSPVFSTIPIVFEHLEIFFHEHLNLSEWSSDESRHKYTHFLNSAGETISTLLLDQYDVTIEQFGSMQLQSYRDFIGSSRSFVVTEMKQSSLQILLVVRTVEPDLLILTDAIVVDQTELENVLHKFLTWDLDSGNPLIDNELSEDVHQLFEVYKTDVGKRPNIENNNAAVISVVDQIHALYLIGATIGSENRALNYFYIKHTKGLGTFKQSQRSQNFHSENDVFCHILSESLITTLKTWSHPSQDDSLGLAQFDQEIVLKLNLPLGTFRLVKSGRVDEDESCLIIGQYEIFTSEPKPKKGFSIFSKLKGKKQSTQESKTYFWVAVEIPRHHPSKPWELRNISATFATQSEIDLSLYQYLFDSLTPFVPLAIDRAQFLATFPNYAATVESSAFELVRTRETGIGTEVANLQVTIWPPSVNGNSIYALYHDSSTNLAFFTKSLDRGNGQQDLVYVSDVVKGIGFNMLTEYLKNPSNHLENWFEIDFEKGHDGLSEYLATFMPQVMELTHAQNAKPEPSNSTSTTSVPKVQVECQQLASNGKKILALFETTAIVFLLAITRLSPKTFKDTFQRQFTTRQEALAVRESILTEFDPFMLPVEVLRDVQEVPSSITSQVAMFLLLKYGHNIVGPTKIIQQDPSDQLGIVYLVYSSYVTPVDSKPVGVLCRISDTHTNTAVVMNQAAKDNSFCDGSSSSQQPAFAKQPVWELLFITDPMSRITVADLLKARNVYEKSNLTHRIVEDWLRLKESSFCFPIPKYFSDLGPEFLKHIDPDQNPLYPVTTDTHYEYVVLDQMRSENLDRTHLSLMYEAKGSPYGVRFFFVTVVVVYDVSGNLSVYYPDYISGWYDDRAKATRLLERYLDADVAFNFVKIGLQDIGRSGEDALKNVIWPVLIWKADFTIESMVVHDLGKIPAQFPNMSFLAIEIHSEHYFAVVREEIKSTSLVYLSERLSKENLYVAMVKYRRDPKPYLDQLTLAENIPVATMKKIGEIEKFVRTILAERSLAASINLSVIATQTVTPDGKCRRVVFQKTICADFEISEFLYVDVIEEQVTYCSSWLSKGGLVFELGGLRDYRSLVV